MVDVVEKIKGEDEWTVGGLMALYTCQTLDEQVTQRTSHDNKMGFNAFDAGPMSSIAQFYQQRGYLTEKQLRFVRFTILKYKQQLQELPVQPRPIKGKKETQGEVEEMMRAELQSGGGGIAIKFRFPRGDSRFSECLNNIKQLPTRRFEKEGKAWLVPYSPFTVERLIEWGFELAPGLKKFHEQQTAGLRTDIPVFGLRGKLYPFQSQAVDYIEKHGGRALIGDEMGLGKTVEALAWIQYRDAYPALVVCPATMKSVWERHANEWLPTWVGVCVLEGTKPYKLPTARGCLYIINYDIMKDWAEEFITLGIQTLVLDECHMVKNHKAQRTKATVTVGKAVPHILPMSGTPIINQPVEFFTALHMIDKEEWPSFWKYAQAYCGARHTGFGWDFSGASKTAELHKRVSLTCMLRRTKGEVLTELPPKRRAVIPLDLPNYSDYRRLLLDIQDKIDKAKDAGRSPGAEVLTAIEKLKQAAVRGKLPLACEWITNFLDTGQKLVVFATHHFVIDRLIQIFKGRAVKLDGRDGARAKEKAVKRFQEDDKITLFIGNVKAAGIGITLTAASTTCFVELGWTPGEHDQAEDRVHRIGQEADSVMAYYLVANRTIEEDIAELIDKKRQILSMVLDGMEVPEESILTELLDRMRGEGGRDGTRNNDDEG